MGVHESQSLLFEMQLARSPEFAEVLAPKIAEHLSLGLTPEELHRATSRVRPGYIRVDADELTYPAHILLRYELERDLIEGQIEVADLPELWDLKMQAYLGLSTAGNDRDGCMQDIHWTDGAFGYFPSYTLGALYAAQQFAAAERAIPELRAKIAQAELSELFDWLQQHIWTQASRLPTPDLIQAATGEGLNSEYFHHHLIRRYLA